MSTDALRDLLHERVADEATVDLASGAWRTGRARRRRRGLATVGGVVAGVVAVGGLVLWVDPSTSDPDVVAPAPVDRETTTPPVETTPDGYLGRLPVYLGPSLVEEPDLPPMVEERPPLPPVIDVEPPTPPVDRIDVAVAAIGIGRGAERAVFLLGPDGSWTTVDTSALTPVGDAAGNLHDPETSEMLAPGGRRLAFPQGDHLVVLSLASGRFERFDLPGYTAPLEFVQWIDDTRVRISGDDVAAVVDVRSGESAVAEPPESTPPAALGPDSSPWGWRVVARSGDAAQAFYATGRVSGTDLVSAEVVVVDDAAGRAVIAIPDSVTAAPPGGGPGRYKGCCPVATWVANGVPAYLSRSARTLLVAWRPRTHDFELVTEVVGRARSVSFADFS